jgi:hypothetical protein
LLVTDSVNYRTDSCHLLSLTLLIAAPVITPLCLQKSKRARKCIVWAGDGFAVMGSASPEPALVKAPSPPALPALRRRSTSTSSGNNDDAQRVAEMSGTDSPVINNARAAAGVSRKRKLDASGTGADAVALVGDVDGGAATAAAATTTTTDTDVHMFVRREGARAQARKRPGRARAS